MINGASEVFACQTVHKRVVQPLSSPLSYEPRAHALGTARAAIGACDALLGPAQAGKLRMCVCVR